MDCVLQGELPVALNDSVDGDGDAKEAPTKKHKHNEKERQRKEIISYKYSDKGRGSLHEAVILSGKPVFIKYDEGTGQVRVVEEIWEGSRIIKPPYPEECPYESYQFANIEEIQGFVKQAKSTNVGSLYLKAKGYVQDFNDQDHNKLVLIASDIIFSYFQDKFATTHYDSIVGDNDSGKSSMGMTFEAMGYRPVYMTDPSAANIFRCLGSTEPGQCTIILDEADKIDKSPEMMAILKTGYQLNGKVPKINTNTLRQEFFYTYALKIIISEKSMSLTEAKGVHDRTFSFTAYAGDSKFDIKETLNPQGNTDCQNRLDEILAFRKLLLIYRLVHFKDHVPDIETGLKRRNRELCKPILQLFQGSTPEIQDEIKSMLEHFLAAKKQRKENTIEVALYPIIISLVSEHGTELPASHLWGTIIRGNVIEGYYDERRPNEFQTADYGTIYRNSITNIISDKFGAPRKHKEKGNVLIFDADKLVKIGKSYGLGTEIQLKLLTSDLEVEAKSEGSESSEGFRKVEGVVEENGNIEKSTLDIYNPNILHESANDDTRHISEANGLQRIDPVKLSDPSDPSGVRHDSGFGPMSTVEPTLPSYVYRLGHSDKFACRQCRIRDDKWGMAKHFHAEDSNERSCQK